MDNYPRSDVIGFIGAPLLIMVPPMLMPFMVFVVLWAVCAWDTFGWRR